MKILYVMPFKISANKWHLTGDSNQASQILRKLTSYPDITIDVVGNFKDNGEDLSEFIKSKYSVNECYDLSSIFDKRTYIKNGFEVLKSMNILDNYDLINIHNSNPSIVSKILTYLPNNKVIFTLHAPPENMTFQYYHKDQYLSLLNDPNKMLLCVSKSHSERCLTALNYYKEFPNGNPSISYILNGISTDDFSSTTKDYDCGTIGRFSPSKSVLESLKCVEAITRHTGGRGFFVGTTSNYEESSESQKIYVDSIMEVLRNNPQIDWYEKLSSDEVKALLGNSKTYLALSTIETFGLTICEAIMQGTPSIGFDTNGIGEIIEEGVTGYKFPNSRGKWDSRYMQSVDLYEKCLALNRYDVRYRAVERFNILRVAQEYYDLYTNFIKR